MPFAETPYLIAKMTVDLPSELHPVLPTSLHPAATMLAPISVLAEFASQFLSILASPAPMQQPLAATALQGHRRFFDVQVRDVYRDYGVFYVLDMFFDL